MIKQLIIALSLVALTACEQQTDTPENSLDEALGVEISEAEPPVVAREIPSESSNRSGKVIFELHCAGCHNPGAAHAATKQLALIRGENMAVIMQRTDLTPDYIKAVVRDGLLEMPPFRPTDINTGELDNLAAYVVSSAQAYQTEGAKNGG